MLPELKALLAEGTPLHPIEPDLWSALAAGGTQERFDDIAASYDRLIGSRLYQRLAWGNDPAHDTRFAERAIASGSGPLLDVGCGSLLFTAEAHAASGRASLLLDLSLGMLRRGAERLRGIAGAVPDHLALLQADALSLPLRDACSDTILCPGILHLFEEPEVLLRELARCLAPGGRLFVTALVTDRAFGRGYLKLLARSGEVNHRARAAELARLVEETTGLEVRCDRHGNMAYLEARREGAEQLAAEGPNAAMIEHWNDRVGPGWVAGQEALDAHLAPLGEIALEAAAAGPGERVLDVGCGCGATSLALARSVGLQGAVQGIDLSAPMLERARARAAEAGLSWLTFHNADAQTASFEGAFDLVFSRFGVMFFSDFPAAFANLRRALRPGGRIAFVCWRELERNPWLQVPLQSIADEIPVPPILPPGQPGPYGLADASSTREWLVESGFADVELTPFDVQLPMGGGADVAGTADFCISMGPVAAALKEAGEAHRDAVHAALRRGLEPYEVEGHVLLGASGWCVTARNPG